MQISRECKEHFYPSESLPKSELGYQSLAIEQLLSLFFVFIAMAIFALLSLFVELMIFKKVDARIPTPTPPQIEATEEGSSGGSQENMMCQVGFNVKVGDTKTHEMFMHKLEELLNDYDVTDIFHVHYNEHV
jgi:hypothetical protein